MALRDDLQDIYDRRGTLTPALVVEEASKVDHPLHSRFEWDNTAAGAAWREHQAQALIRTVRIRYVSESDDMMSDAVRAFTSVRTPAGFAYEPTLSLAMDPLKRDMALADMRRAWQALRRRFEAYEEFWRLVEKDLPIETRVEIAP